jgi:CSLREA domain-containing protein
MKTIPTQFFIALCVATIGLTSSPAEAKLFNVNSTQDAVDVNPGDGICATATGECTLRAAIQETNALPGRDEIFLPGAVYTLTIPGAGEDCAASGDLDITDDLWIRGAGAQATVVDGGGLDRVFQVLPPQPQCGGTGVVSPNVKISGLTIRNGNVAVTGDNGGGINNSLPGAQGGFLTLVEVIVTGNSAVFGGGIFNGWGASASMQRVTISANDAAYGAGLYTRDGDVVTITNSTISGNTATGGGGGIDTWFGASLLLTNVTITQNTAALVGGGINREFNSKQVALSGTIVADNLGGDCAGQIHSKGYNLDSDDTCSLTQPTDVPGRDPLLGPLQDNGGQTPTHALMAGSPAIDAGGTTATGCLPADQRSYLRPGDGIACDIGAYEKGSTTPSAAKR